MKADPRPTKRSLEQAGRFLDWYLNSLVDFQNWQVSMVRRAGSSGKIMLLYPGWGIRSGKIEKATATTTNASLTPHRKAEDE
jgi:hypothetical protein